MDDFGSNLSCDSSSSPASLCSLDSQLKLADFHEIDDKENWIFDDNRCNKSSTSKTGRRKYASEVKIYKITVPSQKVTLDKFRTSNQQTEKNERKQNRPSRKKLKRKPCQHMDCGEDSNFTDAENEEGESSENVEQRRKSIKQKLSTDQDHFHFSKAEEREIHERAEMYSLSVLPDPKYYVLPTDNAQVPVGNQCVTNMYYRMDESYPRKRKRRNYMTDFYYLTPGAFNNQNYCSQHLSQGTKLLRPPDKLVELVYQAVEFSPDGLLQVPQIYTAIMNRYPYFRCMDRPALGSWRSSIRHALYQKWFRKIKFCSAEITSKGCYWGINMNYNLKEMNTLGRLPKKRITRCYLPFHINVKSYNTVEDPEPRPEDYDLDPNTHSHVIALLTEEEEKEAREGYNPRDPSSIQDVIDVAREYGFSINQSCFDAARTDLQATVPRPVNDPDPILSSCAENINYDYVNSNDCSVGMQPTVYSFNVSSTCLSQSSYTHRFHRYSQQHISPFASPLMNNIHPDILCMEPRMDSSAVPLPPWDEYYPGISGAVSGTSQLPFYLGHSSDISSDKASTNSSTDIIEVSDEDYAVDGLSLSKDREGLQFDSGDLFASTDDSLDESCVPLNMSVVSN